MGPEAAGARHLGGSADDAEAAGRVRPICLNWLLNGVAISGRLLGSPPLDCLALSLAWLCAPRLCAPPVGGELGRM